MRSITKVLLGAGFIVIGLFSAQAEDNPKSLVICGTTWGKYGGEELPGKGFVPDLVMRVFREAGYEIRTELVPWPRCVERARRGQYDMVSSAWRGPNFKDDFNPLNVILEDTVNVITLTSSDMTSGAREDLSGKRIGYVRDAGGLDFLDDLPGVTVSKAATLDKLLGLLRSGRIDALVSDPVNLNEQLKTLEPAFEEELRVLEPALVINFNSPQVWKGHPHGAEIAADFDAAFHKLVAEGLYETLIEVHDLQVKPPS